MTDPYGTLGVRADASDEEVARAYKKLAKRYHPDLNPDDASAAAKMGQINQAYDRIKSMRQSGNRQNSSSAGAYGTQSADPFGGFYQAFYRQYGPREQQQYEEYRHYQQVNRVSSLFRVAMAIILGLLLVRIFNVLMLGAMPNQGAAYGGSSQEPAYGYYQYYRSYSRANDEP